jgi:hypothetical protein
VCEPAGNLVKRNILTEQDGIISARPAYPNAEFLASTDERFRPVNLATGPDGALYVVDLYHGIIQHHLYVTSYLRGQILERGLNRPQFQGRIYRVVHEGSRGARNRRWRAREARNGSRPSATRTAGGGTQRSAFSWNATMPRPCPRWSRLVGKPRRW